MIVQRDYLLIIKDTATDKPIDYCRSNTYMGCLNYLMFHNVYNHLLENGSLTFEIIRYTYGEFQKPIVLA